MKRLLPLLLIALYSIGGVTAATVTVDSTRDSFDGNTSSIAALISNPGLDGVIGLREAMIAANNTPGADTINFNIPASDPGCNPTTHVCTMARTSALPAITDAVTINGYSQPGARVNSNPLNAGINAAILIELTGHAGDRVGGIQVNASNTVIRGLNIHGAGDEITLGTSDLSVAVSNVVIAGNFIGTNSAGTAVMGVGGFGVRLNSGSNITIGGPTAADRNLLSGDPQGGIIITGGNGTQILGNYIGTDVTGTVGLNSTGFATGIDMVSDKSFFLTTNTLISGNLISGNSAGGVDASGGGFIRSNLIGTQRNGVSPLGNLNFGGINLREGNGNPWVVGGTTPGQGNTIAFNDGWGVIVPLTASRYSILGNSIYSNRYLGISLRGGSPDPLLNDPGDTDTNVGNRGQNYPVITSASVSGGNVQITGTLNSTANTSFRLEFFGNQTSDPSGFGEGQFFLGSANATTNATGNATFNAIFRSPAGVRSLSATATDPNGNTSEFAHVFNVNVSSAAASHPDFNGDGKTDYLLLNASTRASAIWYLNGTGLAGGAFGPILPAGWTVVATADFDHNGRPDYVLYNPTTRQTAIWFLNNATLLGGSFGPTLPSGWQLVAAPDINLDGKPDYLLLNSITRQTAVWYLNGTSYSSGALGPTLPPGWTLIDALDINADARPDYVLYNPSTRQSAVWYLNGPAFVHGALAPTLPAGWTLVGASDFNGDGKPDLLLYQPGTRRTGVWYLNGTSFAGAGLGPTLPPGYSLVSP